MASTARLQQQAHTRPEPGTVQVLYCPQTRVSAKGTPSELYFAAQQLGAQRGRPRGDLPSLIQQLGLEQGVLNQAWPELSVRLVLLVCSAGNQ